MSLHIFIFWNTLIILKQKAQKWRLETKKIIDENENVKIDNGWLPQKQWIVTARTDDCPPKPHHQLSK